MSIIVLGGAGKMDFLRIGEAGYLFSGMRDKYTLKLDKVAAVKGL